MSSRITDRFSVAGQGAQSGRSGPGTGSPLRRRLLGAAAVAAIALALPGGCAEPSASGGPAGRSLLAAIAGGPYALSDDARVELRRFEAAVLGAPTPLGELRPDDREHFIEAFKRVRSDYVHRVPDATLIDSAIKGLSEARRDKAVSSRDAVEAALDSMLVSLDPHTAYLNPQEFREMRVSTSGEFGGLGIEISVEQGFIKVVAPIEGTPAHRAGILAGDLITHVDGASIEGFTLMDTVVKLRGRPATDVRLTIRRTGAQPFEVTLTRAIIQVQAVRWHAEDDVGYIRVASFNEKVERGIETAFVGLRNQIGSKMRGVVLDLRNNPGGLLDQSVALADAFLETGTIVSVRGRNGDSRNYTARAGELARGLPVVVLLNHGSASASEIVAAALQDHGRATLMGSRSFGKGTVQTIMPLPREGALRLTTALYYTPLGRTIQAYGVDPDVEIVGATEDTSPGEADLPGAFGGETRSATRRADQPRLDESRCPLAVERRDDRTLGCAIAFIRAGSADKFQATLGLVR